MKTSSFKGILRGRPNHHLQFILPDGTAIPLHAHITEVGRVDKTFLDCGATARRLSYLCLQAWVADDVDHRLTAGKLVDIIDRATTIFGKDDHDVELEYEDGVISQYPLEGVKDDGEKLIFSVGLKHTDCLAKDICLPPSREEDEVCCSGTGCC